MVSDKWATVLATSMFIVIRFATSLIKSSRMLVNKKTQPYHEHRRTEAHPATQESMRARNAARLTNSFDRDV